MPTRIQSAQRFGDRELTPDSIKEIVGVVDDLREGPLDAQVWPAVYHPFEEDPGTFCAVLARAVQDERAILPSLDAAIRAIDPELGTRNGGAMRDRIKDSPVAYLRRSSTWLVGGFAGLALLLSVIGLCGVVAYSVGQRTREIGLRVAMGAERRAVYWLILGEAGRLVAFGVLLGGAAAVLQRRAGLHGPWHRDLPVQHAATPDDGRVGSKVNGRNGPRPPRVSRSPLDRFA